MPEYEDKLRAALAEGPVQAESDQLSAVGDRLRRALSAGKYGAITGASLGLLRSLTAPEGQRDYLKNTLAGALIGGVGAGGVSYLAGGDPWSKASPAAKSFEAGQEEAQKGLANPNIEPGDAVRRGLYTGLTEWLSGKHEFTPAEQQALVQQLVKSKVPTGAGWRKRITLAEQAVQQLQSNPTAALPSLVMLQRVVPDAETRAYINEAVADIRSGRAQTPEGLNALASLGRAIQERIGSHREATQVIDALNMMKELYGANKLSPENVAKNVGLVTGRFGSKSESAERMRQLLQETLARPVPTTPSSPYPATANPTLQALVARALR